MIQLYKKGNHMYSMNGDHVLQAVECVLDRTLNGAWELYLEVPLDKKGIFKDVINESVIKAPTPEGDRLFSIYDTNKISDDVLSACARPVFFNSAQDAFLMDVRPTGKNGQEALNIMTAGTQYSGKSNITKVNTAYYVRKNLMEAINSDDEQSFLNRWGGEVIYNDFEIVINDRVGGDYGVKILYGKNLEAIQEHCNIEDVVTRIIPIAYNGYMLEGETPWVDSPLIGSYENIRYRVIKYEDVKLAADCSEDETGFNTLAELRSELIRRCNQEYDLGIDKPKVTIEVNMIDLAKTVEYKNYKILETVSLGDSIHCKHAGLGIETDARVIQQKWDCIRKRNNELIVGDFQFNYFNKLSSTIKSTEKAIRPDGTVMGEKIAGFIDGAMAMLKAQYDVAKKQDVLAILFENLDEESDLYGAMALGTQGLMISKTRMTDGRNWDWTTALTANGLIANIIVAGILSDKEEKNYWDLDHSEFRLSADSFTIDDKTAQEYFEENWTQEDVFNKLTNNGASKGIYMQNGQLYINLSYCQTGTLVVGGTGNTYAVVEIRDNENNVTGSINNTGATFRNLTVGDRMLITDLSNTYQVSIGFDQSTGEFYISGNAISTIVPNLKTNKLTSEETEAGTLTAGQTDITGNATITGILNGNTAKFASEVYAPNMETTMLTAADGNIGTSKFTDYGGTSRRPLASFGTNGRRIAYIASRGTDGSEYINVNGQFSDDASVTDYASRKISISTSDFRLKKNVLPTQVEALPLIRQIKMKQFDWIKSGAHQNIGFIADLLERLDNNLAIGGGYDEDGNMDLKVVNDFYLLGYVVKAIQELDEQVTEMKGSKTC